MVLICALAAKIGGLKRPCDPNPKTAPESEDPFLVREATRVQRFVTDYAWFLVRNIIGWVLVIASLPIGFATPGPLGLPIFLVGFALVTFPGKRRLTARVLRGRRLRLEHPFYSTFAAFVAIVIPALVLWFIAAHYHDKIERFIRWYAPRRMAYYLIPLLLIALTWLVTRLSLKVLNLLLVSLPILRRKIRPLLRRWGVKVLPPRRQRESDEILEIDPSYRKGAERFWNRLRPWLWRIAGLGITAAILFYMFKKIALHWHDPAVRSRVLATSPLRFLVASAMFALFLFAFRAFTWRKILKGFGYALPYAAAIRIWSISELARYLPGSILQVVGRVYLAKPYGVPGSIVSTSQVLELATFLLANTLVAVPCLLFAGARSAHLEQARIWYFVAMGLVPLLTIVLHPRVFYGITNRILARLGKPAIARRLSGAKLFGLLIWSIFGLLFQSLAILLLVKDPLGLPWIKWWVVAGAYCLAWIGGFLAIWAPGGLGVREFVFVAAMRIAIPHRFKEQFPDQASFNALVVFLSLLLRLWTIGGELIFSFIASACDYRGLLGLANAPGQIKRAAQTPALTESSQSTTRASSAA